MCQDSELGELRHCRIDGLAIGALRKQLQQGRWRGRVQLEPLLQVRVALDELANAVGDALRLQEQCGQRDPHNLRLLELVHMILVKPLWNHPQAPARPRPARSAFALLQRSFRAPHRSQYSRTSTVLKVLGHPAVDTEIDDATNLRQGQRRLRDRRRDHDVANIRGRLLHHQLLVLRWDLRMQSEEPVSCGLAAGQNLIPGRRGRRRRGGHGGSAVGRRLDSEVFGLERFQVLL
mmetsp:Transcript_28929/g.96312  ORF Transcript_28929/g.96312 Transcript_28929/m.96312 type:complete len:234 (+) Transcript_28929:3676-4377(+)